ncbi:hypothetical protein [Streptomyces sp. CB01881]|uniref:hypothetical protein n=1 Tax=Streptomyces sp. CB01881 TaxID=2078691 RepID=UPI0011DF186C|nr:hypothetical protein [Streptomyces sp. CB01881]TYC76417.1 hypothetical protein EH183_02000 [Streptomyces sp. CB01881]
MTDYATGRAGLYLSRGGAAAVPLPLPEGHRVGGLVLKDGVLGWIECSGTDKNPVAAPTACSIADGKVTAQYALRGPGGGGPTVGGPLLRLAGGRLLWAETPPDRARNSSIRSGVLDGSGVTEVLSADLPAGARIRAITASDQAVTYERCTANPQAAARPTPCCPSWGRSRPPAAPRSGCPATGAAGTRPRPTGAPG